MHACMRARGQAGELEWTEGMLFLPGRPSPYISSWWSGVGEGKGPSNHLTIAKDAKDGVLAGRLWTARTNTMINTPDWKLDASFSVPLQKQLEAKVITGAAAESHPAAITARQYLGAMRSGNRDAIRDLQVASERGNFDRAMTADRWEELRPELRSQGERAAALPRVTVKVKGVYATVEFGAAGSGRVQFAMVLKQENGKWWSTNEQP